MEKIQLVEEREEIRKEGDETSKVTAGVEKGKRKKGKFFEKINHLLF